MPKGKVLARLGHVLYWLGCVLAAVVAVWGAVFCLRDGPTEDVYLLPVAAIAAFAVWAIGMALRYILSGK